MKVLWFSNTPANGIKYFDQKSIGGGWLESLDELLQDKLELHIAFYYPGHFESFKFGKTIYHPISRKNWKFHSLKSSFFTSIVFENDIDLYLAIVEKVKPDIIHIHGTENPFGYIQTRVNIPVVFSIQGIINVYLHKYSVGFEEKYLNTNSKSITGGVKNYLLNENFLKSKRTFAKMNKRETDILLGASYIIGRTNWDKRVTNVLAPRSYYFHNDEMLRSSFYENVWLPREAKGKFLIFTTNGNTPYKGFETICQTLILLRNLDFDVEWRVAGISNNDLIVKIARKKFKKDFPDSNLVLLGKLPENKILEHLKDAHLYIMPSHIENSPNNLCEAMILGMPCLATFAGGTDTILENNVTGILIQDGDPWSMAGAIREIKKNYRVAVNRGIKAREISLFRHDRSRNVNNLIRIYSSIIKKFKPSGD